METATTAKELEIETLKTRKAALVFRAINHELRMKILKLIHASPRITVTEMYRKLRLVQSVASQHLAILRKAGMVSTERDRRFLRYSVNYKRLEELGEIAKQLLTYG